MSNERVKSGLLGVLPEGWSAERLGHIGLFLRGGGGSKQDEVDDGLPCVRYGDLYTHHDCRITDTRSRISPDRVNSYTPLRYGDVLFASSGETVDDIGRSAVNLMSGRAYCGGDVIILRPAIEVNSSFLGHVADCASSRIQKSRLGRGSTVIHIYDEELRDLVIPVPPLEEQQRIAEILDTVDEAIRASERVVNKLIHTHSGVIGSAIEAAALTGNPSTVEREFEIETGIVLNASRIPKSNPIGYLRVANVQRGKIEISNLTTLEAAEDEARRKALATGDLLVVEGHANPNEIGRCAVVPQSAEGLLFQNHLYRLRPRSMTSDLAQVILNSAEAKAYWRRMCATSSGLHTVNSSMLRSMPISVPSRDQQRVLSGLIAACDGLVSAEQQELRKLRKLRSGLAADLLSGRIRTVAT